MSSQNNNTFSISQAAYSEAGGDADSILSSRMTDIASDDGNDHAANTTAASAVDHHRRSAQTGTGDAISRPNTAVTGVSSQRGAWSQAPPSRRPFGAGQRGSIPGSISSLNTVRPPSARTHVPSITSHAFFRPMSSQRLQAQRGGPRPPTLALQGSMGEDGYVEGTRNSITSAPRQGTVEDGDGRAPPSRGTEMTEQDTAERVTINTSPTQGYYPAGSVSESVRPLQRNLNLGNPKGLSLNPDKGYKNSGGLNAPSKSPRSFRSSFLIPAKNDAAPNSPNRNTQGREKLSSSASSPVYTPTTDVTKRIANNSNLGGNYKYFTGNTVFCWGGRLQNTRHKPINIATGLIVVLPATLFYIFSASWLWDNISPAIPIVFAYAFFICMSSFIHASVSDPGILPRNVHQMPPPEENEDPLRLGPPMNDWTMIKSAQSVTAAMEVPTKYCRTCNIWRPPRGHHCRICDNCIETQDHHCVWLNNCVGRRNYRYFFTFVASCAFLGLFLLGASLAQLIVYQHQQNISFTSSINHFRIPFAMVIYGAFASTYPLALMGYHMFLMGRGETTREYLNSHKFLKQDRHRPFTQENIIKNWLVVLCRPRPPTYLRFKRKYEEGDQRFGERRGKRTAPLVNEAQDGGTSIGMEMHNVQSEHRGFEGPMAVRDNHN